MADASEVTTILACIKELDDLEEKFRGKPSVPKKDAAEKLREIRRRLTASVGAMTV